MSRRLRESTEELRKTHVVIELLELAAEEVVFLRARHADEQTFRNVVTGAIHRHLSAAFDAGAAKTADLQIALDARTEEVMALRRKLRASGTMPALRAPEEKE